MFRTRENKTKRDIQDFASRIIVNDNKISPMYRYGKYTFNIKVIDHLCIFWTTLPPLTEAFVKCTGPTKERI
jgi:hypothetical protein